MLAEQSLQTILDSKNNSFAGLVNKVKCLTELSQLWHTIIEPALLPHCRVANLRDKRLIIEVDSAAWLTRLRYQLPELLTKLRSYSELRDLQAIDWYIEPNIPTTQQSNAHPKPFSPHTVQLLHETAEGITNETLRNALLRLARDGIKKK